MVSLIEAAKIYYARYFSFKPLIETISLKNFSNREFGFTVIKEGSFKFIRNLSFKSPSSLKNFMISRGVIGSYIGAIYDPPPTPKKPIDKSNWIGRELVFDLDLTDYDEIRTCGTGKDHYCNKCWPLIIKAAKFIDETLREDFGYENLKWVYSGRRGLHAWVLDEEAFIIDERAREAIAEYVALKKEEDFFPTRYMERAIRIYTGMEITEVLRTKQQKLLLKKIWSKVRKELPRIDKKVTMDIVRLLRMPGSIHDSTGKIVTIVENLDDFYPDTVPDVWEIIGEEKPKFKLL